MAIRMDGKDVLGNLLCISAMRAWRAICSIAFSSGRVS